MSPEHFSSFGRLLREGACDYAQGLFDYPRLVSNSLLKFANVLEVIFLKSPSNLSSYYFSTLMYVRWCSTISAKAKS